VLCNECIVFEDSEAGINSAINAKMKVIGIYRDEIHRNELIGASLFINDYTQINTQEIINLFDTETC
jgi:beta-phosphoglucomutase-like phosphatase (HAD superfamily)